MSFTPNTPTEDRAAWWSQLQELFDARAAMAQLEIRHDIASARRLGIVAGVGAVFAITSLPLLVVVLSQVLAELTGSDVFWWQLMLGTGLLIVGSLLMWIGWRSFRHNFSGLSETVDELKEDRIWLEELARNITNREW